MKLDLTQLITAADKAEAARAARSDAARAECARRIGAVVNQTAQMNLAAAAAGGLLAPADAATYRAGLAWIAAMRAVWRGVADTGRDPAEDANWPAPPAAVIDLGRRF